MPDTSRRIKVLLDFPQSEEVRKVAALSRRTPDEVILSLVREGLRELRESLSEAIGVIHGPVEDLDEQPLDLPPRHVASPFENEELAELMECLSCGHEFSVADHKRWMSMDRQVGSGYCSCGLVNCPSCDSCHGKCGASRGKEFTLNATQAADILGVEGDAVCRMAQADEIGSSRSTGPLKFNRDDVNALKAKMEADRQARDSWRSTPVDRSGEKSRLTAKQVAAELNVHVNSVYDVEKRRELVSLKEKGGKKMYDRAAVMMLKYKRAGSGKKTKTKRRKK